MNFEEYKEKYPRLKNRISSLEKRNKTADILLDLEKHEGMKMLIEQLDVTIKNINLRLLSPDKLEVNDREVLLTDRERCEWLLNIFDSQKLTKTKIENYLNKLK